MPKFFGKAADVMANGRISSRSAYTRMMSVSGAADAAAASFDALWFFFFGFTFTAPPHP